jgi:hypothetical protein
MKEFKKINFFIILILAKFFIKVIRVNYPYRKHIFSFFIAIPIYYRINLLEKCHLINFK